MRYDYKCNDCCYEWEDGYPMDARDKPLSEPCPNCSKEGSVARVPSAVKMSYQGQHTVQKRAGSEWNDVLTKIKSNNFGSTIETR